MKNNKEIFQYTLNLLGKLSVRYQFMEFSSGAIMLDIWFGDRFYVIQFEDFIGISEITTDNPGFDLHPDEKFINENLYKDKLKSLFNSNIF